MAGRGRTERKERVPFGVRRQKLSLDDETKTKLKAKGLEPRWVNDDAGRLEDAQAGGYEFVTASGEEKVGDAKESADKGRKMKKLVGKHQDGSPKYAYLMGIKKKWYEEDQAKKEEANKMVDEAIQGGNPSGLAHHGVDPSKGSSYVKNINYKP